MNVSKKLKGFRRGLDIIVHGYNDVQGIRSDSVDELINGYRGDSIVLWELPDANGLRELLMLGKEVSFKAFRQFLVDLPKIDLTKVVCEELYHVNKRAKTVIPIGGVMNSDPMNNYSITYNALKEMIDNDFRNLRMDIYVDDGHRGFLAYALKKLNFHISEEVHSINGVAYDSSRESLFWEISRPNPKKVMKKLKELMDNSLHLNNRAVNQQYIV